MEDTRFSVGGQLMFAIFLVLIILKLAGVLNISWWLVTLPLWYWIPLMAIIIFIGLPIYLFIRFLIELGRPR